MGQLTVMDGAVLERERYLIGLVNEGRRVGLLDEDGETAIHAGILKVFRTVMDRYTRGESATLRVETAEGLMESILFAMNLYLQNSETPEQGLGLLEVLGPERLYGEATECLMRYVHGTEQLYQRLEAERVPVDNCVYNETFQYALPSFFHSYDPVFAAQDNSGDSDIDYPLVYDDMSVPGPRYIRNYLEAFAAENGFCKRFEPEALEALLRQHGRLQRVDWRQSPVNLFMPVFTNALFSILLEGDPRHLELRANEMRNLTGRLGGLSEVEIHEVVRQGARKLGTVLDIRESDVLQLMERFADDLALRMKAALENGNLEGVAIVWPDQEPERLELQSGGSLHPGAFRYVYEQLLQAETMAQKLALVQESIRSMEDFVALLRGDCFTETEYPQLFESLSEIEMWALTVRGIGGVRIDGSQDVLQMAEEAKSGSYAWERAWGDWCGTRPREWLEALAAGCRRLQLSERV